MRKELAEMRLIVIMPVYNEAEHLVEVLDSFVAQSRCPDQLIVVDDGSSDQSPQIIAHYTRDYPWISSIRTTSDPERIPGAKVVTAFDQGLKTVHADDWDLIGKFDGDIVLPPNYFERLLSKFKSDHMLGMAAGNLYILNYDEWVYERVADKSKVRGPIKLYRKACYLDIGGLRKGIGWDTADELLARHYGWHAETDTSLHVRHLKPTGKGYSTRNANMQGRAFKNLRYGLALSFLSAVKLSWRKKNIMFFFNCMRGYFNAPGVPIVSPQEGRLIREMRWKGVRSKLFGN